MPDFENDEIRDSSFPVEFNDETETLDMYGVWVKSGPRDVSSLVEEDESGSVDTVLPVFSDVPDISEFDELPDIEDFDAESTEPDVTEQDVVSDELSPDTSFELPDFDTPKPKTPKNRPIWKKLTQKYRKLSRKMMILTSVPFRSTNWTP